MAVAPFTRRIPKHFRKTITFAGGVGTGAIGTVAVSTVTGAVVITHGGIRCTTLLASAGGGSISLGTAGNVDGIVEATLATDIDANEFWQDASPEVRVSPSIINLNVAGDLILTVSTGDITAGVLEIDFYYLPLSADGQMA